MKSAWAFAFANLRRNRKRNLATVAAIAFGYAGLVLLGGYAVRIERFLKANAVFIQHANHVAVWVQGGLDNAAAEPDKYQFDKAQTDTILAWAKGDKRVERATRYLRGFGMAGNACATRPANLLGIDPQEHAALLQHPELLEASPELARPAQGQWAYQVKDAPRGVALAAGLQKVLQKPKVFDEVRGRPPAPTVLDCDTPKAVEQLAADADIQIVGQTYDGTLNAVDGQMVASFHAAEPIAEDTAMIVPLASLQTLYATERITYVGLLLHDSADAGQVALDLKAALAAKDMKTDTYTYADQTWAPYYVGTMAFLGSMVGFITMLVTAVLVFTVAGAMTLAILERLREFGTWRALGFERGHVVGLLVRESLLVSLIGLAVGLAIGLCAAFAINSGGFRFSPPGVAGSIQLLITPAVWACAAQAMLLPPGIMVATWWVVRGQMRKKPVDLLNAATA